MRILFRFYYWLVCVMLLLSSINSINNYSQTCYNSFIDSVISRSDLQSIRKINRELSGDTSTIIGGMPYTIFSRYYLSPANEKSAQYIYEKFQSYGLSVRNSAYSVTGKNVIAKKVGLRYPNKQFLICAHYDNTLFSLQDTIHGADDNASGLCAVLEAARLLSQYSFDYTIIFAALDEEEINFSGSISYADSAFINGDSLMGVINLDMIGYDSNNDFRLDIASNLPSSGFADVLVSSCMVYQPQLVPSKAFNIYGSDQRSFWAKGFICSAFHESTSDLNPSMHTLNDNFAHLNQSFMHSIIKSAVAALASLADDYIINIYHIPIESAHDTSARVVNAVVKSTHRIAAGNNRPRLYYRRDNADYSFRYAFYSSGDTSKFLIPGFPAGSTVEYYIAVQDSAGTMTGSSPPGARGTNPPGNIPPANPHKYYVSESLDVCGSELPIDIAPGFTAYDTIFVNQSKIIDDINIGVSINFPNDQYLSIYLLRDGYNITLLSANNGGDNANYMNTVFDDEADTLISYGTPPFNGHYIPEKRLNAYYNSTTYGKWVIKVVNSSPMLSGQVVNWCIDFDYHEIISVNNNQTPLKFKLSQNYPNPFNAATRIEFELAKKDNINLVVYDVSGREVAILANGDKNPGNYEVSWDASNFSSGIYFYRFTGKYINETKKMILIK